MPGLKKFLNGLLGRREADAHLKNKKSQTFRNVAYIELSNVCNAKCIFCPYPQIAASDKNMQNMDDATFAASLQKAVDLGYSRLGFTPTTGELFANKHWAEHIASALRHDKIKSLYYYSNAILLTDDNIEKILALPNRHKIEKFCFSVGGSDAATYKKMFAVDKFEVVQRNINALCAKLKAAGSDLKINCELRLAKTDKTNKSKAQKTFNRAGYAHFHPNIVKVFDPLGGLIHESDLDYLPEISHKPDPCYRLNDIRFDANGKVWMCGCVVSERPGESSLQIGSLTDSREDLEKKRQAVFAQWRGQEKIPSACQPCRLYKAAK
ncbi:MAG: radical SAM protein [Gammaproteobacteria bacterium]|nr:radical SAM protein [Gammaproteobacteria bacterium]